MPNHKNIFRNKVDFAHEEFATELYKPKGIPRMREPRSQKGQYRSHALRHGQLTTRQFDLPDARR